MADPLDSIPEALRDTARSALAAALDGAGVTALRPVAGGGSGALAYRVEAGERAVLLRLEQGLNALANPLHYPCMKAAAEAGIAPALRFVDGERGVAVMDFVTPRPLESYPGGPPALARDMGLLIRRLQDTTTFPVQGITYSDLIARMLAFLRGSNVFAPGVLDLHAAACERIRAAYPWRESTQVASHNDPNPRNVIFDGTRLWLIDWETACRNDSLTDVAVVTHELAAAPELQESLLRGWLGREPDRAIRGRLTLMRQLTRLFFACALLRFFANVPGRQPDPSLHALTPAEFVAALQSGKLRLGTPQVLYEFAKMFLVAFAAELAAPGFEAALAAAGEG